MLCGSVNGGIPGSTSTGPDEGAALGVALGVATVDGLGDGAVEPMFIVEWSIDSCASADRLSAATTGDGDPVADVEAAVPLEHPAAARTAISEVISDVIRRVRLTRAPSGSGPLMRVATRREVAVHRRPARRRAVVVAAGGRGRQPAGGGSVLIRRACRGAIKHRRTGRRTIRRQGGRVVRRRPGSATSS